MSQLYKSTINIKHSPSLVFLALETDKSSVGYTEVILALVLPKQRRWILKRL